MGRVGRAARAPLCLAFALAGLVGCAATPGGHRGVTHIVRPEETVYRISRFYGVRVHDVVRVNRIRDVSDVAIGTPLWIPGARRAPPSAPLPFVPGPASARASAPRPPARALARREANLTFDWPLRGRVSSGFGRRNGHRHDGIDIPARSGTPVRAAEAGRVIHSGRGLGAYGRAVIVKHAGRYSTVYAHNRVNYVRRGEFVEKGQAIAEVGTSGNASGPHVHFEIRRDRRAQNPISLLP